MKLSTCTFSSKPRSVSALLVPSRPSPARASSLSPPHLPLSPARTHPCPRSRKTRKRKKKTQYANSESTAHIGGLPFDELIGQLNRDTIPHCDHCKNVVPIRRELRPSTKPGWQRPADDSYLPKIVSLALAWPSAPTGAEIGRLLRRIDPWIYPHKLFDTSPSSSQAKANRCAKLCGMVRLRARCCLREQSAVDTRVPYRSLSTCLRAQDTRVPYRTASCCALPPTHPPVPNTSPISLSSSRDIPMMTDLLLRAALRCMLLQLYPERVAFIRRLECVRRYETSFLRPGGCSGGWRSRLLLVCSHFFLRRSIVGVFSLSFSPSLSHTHALARAQPRMMRMVPSTPTGIALGASGTTLSFTARRPSTNRFYSSTRRNSKAP